MSSNPRVLFAPGKISERQARDGSVQEWFDVYSHGFHRYSHRTIGIEKEFPVVKKDNFLAFDVRQIFPDLIKMGMEPFFDDFYENEVHGVKLSDGTKITTDAGWGTLELCLPPLNSLFKAEELFREKIELLKELCGRKGGIILGYGIQPIQPLQDSNRIKKRRNLVLRGILGRTSYTTVTASDQVHLSVSAGEAVRANNVFNWLSGVIISIFANSPIWLGKNDGNQLAVREFVWGFGPPNRHGVFPGPDKDLKEFFEKIINLPFLVAKKGKDYFPPDDSFMNFLLTHPQREFIREFPQMEGTLWFCARPRTVYGTIEVRPACAQPRESALSLAAFCLGILEELKEAEKLIEDTGYSWSIARAMREGAMAKGLWALVNDEMPMAELTTSFLNISRVGLKKRGLGEEVYLQPLWDRVIRKETLAEQIIGIFKRGGIPALVGRIAY